MICKECKIDKREQDFYIMAPGRDKTCKVCRKVQHAIRLNERWENWRNTHPAYFINGVAIIAVYIVFQAALMWAGVSYE